MLEFGYYFQDRPRRDGKMGFIRMLTWFNWFKTDPNYGWVFVAKTMNLPTNFETVGNTSNITWCVNPEDRHVSHHPLKTSNLVLRNLLE
jgi:hypothetical protein